MREVYPISFARYQKKKFKSALIQYMITTQKVLRVPPISKIGLITVNNNNL